jgi:periplasmic protein TonB
MEVKKNNKANLEKMKSVFLEIGFVVVLAVMLVAFEWTSKPSDVVIIEDKEEGLAPEEMTPVTRQEQQQQPDQPPPQIPEEFEKVDDTEEFEDDFEGFDVSGDLSDDFSYEIMDVDDEVEEEQVFMIVEDMPTFKGGGTDKFQKYVYSKLKYPDIARENGISGRVVVKFVVDQTGQVTDVTILRGVDPALDQEALRVVRASPKWAPGKQRGRPVKVQFVFPITFVLQ